MNFKISEADKALFHELTTADRDTQVIAAANLAKIGRWDVLSWISHIPGMLEDVKARLKKQGYALDMANIGNDPTAGSFNRAAAEREYWASKALQHEFFELETYLAYCEARSLGKRKILGQANNSKREKGNSMNTNWKTEDLQPSKTEKELIQQLKDAEPDTRLKVAVNLAKAGHWDIISCIPGCRMQSGPPCPKKATCHLTQRERQRFP